MFVLFSISCPFFGKNKRKKMYIKYYRRTGKEMLYCHPISGIFLSHQRIEDTRLTKSNCISGRSYTMIWQTDIQIPYAFDIGADPKSVVCAFFKQGQCTKGDKCKFSHDLTLERKCEKGSVCLH